MFNPIDNAMISAGEPVTQDLWSRTKLNFDDHESRLLTVEGATGAFHPIQMDIYGEYSFFGAVEGQAFTRITFNLTVLAGRLMVHKAGTAGDTEIDILYKRGANPFVSIFTTLPSVNFSSGNLAIGTGVLDPGEVDLLAGDILRLDLVSSQTSGIGLSSFLEIEKT